MSLLDVFPLEALEELTAAAVAECHFEGRYCPVEARCGEGKQVGICAPCVSAWVEPWFDAEDRLHAKLAALGWHAESKLFLPRGNKSRARATG